MNLIVRFLLFGVLLAFKNCGLDKEVKSVDVCAGTNFTFIFEAKEQVYTQTWYFNGTKIAASTKNTSAKYGDYISRIVFEPNNQNGFTLKDVTKKDEGVYKYVYEWEILHDKDEMEIKVYDTPTALPYFTNKTDKNGEVEQITCNPPNPGVNVALKNGDGEYFPTLTVVFKRDSYNCCIVGISARCYDPGQKEICVTYSPQRIFSISFVKDSCDIKGCFLVAFIAHSIAIFISGFVIACFRSCRKPKFKKGYLLLYVIAVIAVMFIVTLAFCFESKDCNNIFFHIILTVFTFASVACSYFHCKKRSEDIENDRPGQNESNPMIEAEHRQNDGTKLEEIVVNDEQEQTDQEANEQHNLTEPVNLLMFRKDTQSYNGHNINTEEVGAPAENGRGDNPRASVLDD